MFPTEMVQHEVGRSHRGMSSKGKFFLDGEDVDLPAGRRQAIARFVVERVQKDSLGEVEFAGDELFGVLGEMGTKRGGDEDYG